MSACEQRGYHRIRRQADIAACIDCPATGPITWGRAELHKEGDAILKLGNAVEDFAKRELRAGRTVVIDA